MKRALAVLALLLAGCAGPELRSSLPPPVAPEETGALAPALAPADAAPALQRLRDAVAAALKEHAELHASLDVSGGALRLRLRSDELFEAQDAQLRVETLDAYAAIATALKAQPAVVLHVIGYGDAESGTAPEESLAARRAASAQEELRRHGLPAARLRAEGRSGPAQLDLVARAVVAGHEADAWMPPAD